MPQISVIVPVYKVEPYLHRCVDSILGQTFSDFELILVDDGSPDSCGTICDEYAAKDSRVVVIHQQNGGLSAARNTGIDWTFANSDSKWLTFIDSDDWVHNDYLLSLYTAVQTNGVLISKCRCLSVSVYPLEEKEDTGSFRVMHMVDGYLGSDSSVCAPAKLYHKSCIGDIRFPVGKLHEDLFTTYKFMFGTDRIALTETPLYYYWTNPDSITNSKWSVNRLDEFAAFEEQLAYFSERDMDSVRNKLVGRYLWAIGRQFGMLERGHAYGDDVKYYSEYMRTRMRMVIRQYALKAKLPFKEYAWCYEIAYPKIMRYYWTVCALQNKIKGLIS